MQIFKNFPTGGHRRKFSDTALSSPSHGVSMLDLTCHPAEGCRPRFRFQSLFILRVDCNVPSSHITVAGRTCLRRCSLKLARVWLVTLFRGLSAQVNRRNVLRRCCSATWPRVFTVTLFRYREIRSATVRCSSTRVSIGNTALSMSPSTCGPI